MLELQHKWFLRLFLQKQSLEIAHYEKELIIKPVISFPPDFSGKCMPGSFLV